MRTPKIYTDNLKKGIITREMLSECLFSVNKRAKNCRDKEREYRNCRYDYYGNEEKYRNKKQEYYENKEILLGIVEPTCIHEETYYSRRRIYEYEEEYEKYYFSEYNLFRCYYDKELRDTVYFIDIPEEKKKYYYFYDFGNHSFHTPIYYGMDIKKLRKESNIDVVSIDTIITKGKDINDLLSNQFIKKVIDMIKMGSYELVA